MFFLCFIISISLVTLIVTKIKCIIQIWTAYKKSNIDSYYKSLKKNKLINEAKKYNPFINIKSWLIGYSFAKLSIIFLIIDFILMFILAYSYDEIK